MTIPEIQDRIEALRKLQEDPTPEAAKELLERWPDDLYDNRVNGWRPRCT